jgi:sugar lactone lactonase YvrE
MGASRSHFTLTIAKSKESKTVMHRLFSLFVLMAMLPSVRAAELRFAGTLGNSGGSAESLATFSGKPTWGIGPVLDKQDTLWERGGSTQLNRYALDGRLLATYPIPGDSDRNRDRLVLAGDHLIFTLRKSLYRLPVSAKAGTKPERLKDRAEALSSSSFAGRAAIYDAGQIFWLAPKTGERVLLVKPEASLQSLFVDPVGVVYGFSNDKVFAWQGGKPVAGYPKPFRGGFPQKVGQFWYSHSWHGTIFRYNENFEPSPGVVMGGASGSFIGYLPQSADLNHGTGLIHVRDDLFAVSGHESVVQLMRWREKKSQFEMVRRLGPLHKLDAVALDAEGNIWTPGGSWRWTASAETPLTLADVEPQATTQPVVVAGKTLCFVKKHYSYVERCRGPLIDASGWAHMENRGIQGIQFEKNKPDQWPTGAAAYTDLKGKLRWMAIHRDGKALAYQLSDTGQLSEKPVATIQLPGLTQCTSLAWFKGQLLAADRGSIVVFAQSDKGWEEKKRLTGFGETIYIHSDGKRLIVSDKQNGRVQVYESLDKTSPPVVYGNLKSPTVASISGDRAVVYESGAQRLVKLEWADSVSKSNVQTAKAIGTQNKKPEFAPAEYIQISKAGGLSVSVAIRHPNKGLSIAVKTLAGATEVMIGAANDKDAYIVSGSHAQLPAGDWSKLRLVVRVKTVSQQERLGFRDGQPIHSPFSKNPSDWAVFDLASHREMVAERRQQIRIDFAQPADGKATLVIENESGQRVRNLISGRSFAAGKQSVLWDGLDENGKLVSPGKYTWRGITHPGIRPDFRMTFAGGREPVNARPWGPNHGLLHSAASDGKHVFFAASVTEGGWALMALDADGKFIQGYEHQHGLGINHDAIAVDGKYLYCAQDGFAWGGGHKVDWKSDKWKANWTVSVVRYDIQTGRMVAFPGKQRALTIDTMEVGPGSAHPDLKSYNLGGLAVAGGKIYVGSRNKNAVLVFDATSGKKLDPIPLKGVRHLAAKADALYAAADDGVYRVKDGKRMIAAGKMKLTGLAIGPKGDLWVSDQTSHQVHRFSLAGKRVDTLGTPGGPYKGAYDPNRMVNPAGLTFGPEGKLWVTEKRWNPKRVLAWNLKSKKVVYEKFGIPHYGGDGSGFDPENPRRWIGLGCFWDVDIDKGTAKPTHIMAMDEAHFKYYHPQGYTFFREAGRTFLYTRGKISLICEVFKDGTIREIAAATGTHHFAYGCDWKPPQAYIDAFYAKWPDKRKEEKPGRGGDGKPWAGRVAGMLWVDRNADGKMQKKEISFTEERVGFAGGAWGSRQDSLTFRFGVTVDKQVKMVEIKPEGFLANGVPDYPTLGEAMKTATTDIGLTSGYKRRGVATARDRFGRFVFNSDPEMNAYDAKGKHLWSYPNRWSNVHGSHKAPLPETGVMQGTMGFLGMAPFDDQTDVFFINGNHGRCYLMTSDGLYLDETFTDVRVSYLKNEYRLGGEIFGGTFDRAKDGNYYVQIGHGPYRIYQLHGLDKAKRIHGSLAVSKQQVAAAERKKLRQVARKQVAKTFSIPGRLKWDQSGKFKAQLVAKVEGDHLHLTYQVEDPSPWVNNGRDWTTLFATGDTVDMQIGVNAKSDAKRRKPVEGDQRLLIGSFEGKPIAVLYQHRKPGGKNPIKFTSPWRGEKVDHVERISDAKIEVKKTNRGYVVDAKIPLKSIGLNPSVNALRADFGVTFGNAEGTDTQLRSYWANPATMLVDDIPGEIMLHPHLWGNVRFDR